MCIYSWGLIILVNKSLKLIFNLFFYIWVYFLLNKYIGVRVGVGFRVGVEIIFILFYFNQNNIFYFI